MRRTVVIISVLLVGFLVGLFIFNAYNNSSEQVKADDLDYTSLSLKDGTFTGKFSIKRTDRKLCEYTYEIKNKKLYITLYATAGNKEPLELDDKGYTEIRIENLKKVTAVYYRTSDKDTNLNVKAD